MKYIVKFTVDAEGVGIPPSWQELTKTGLTKKDWISSNMGFRDKLGKLVPISFMLEYPMREGHLSNTIHDLDRGWIDDKGNTYIQMVFETLDGAENYKSFLETRPSDTVSVTIEPIDL